MEEEKHLQSASGSPENFQIQTQNPQFPVDKQEAIVHLWSGPDAKDERNYLQNGVVINNRLVVNAHCASFVRFYSLPESYTTVIEIPKDASYSTFGQGDLAKFDFTVQGVKKSLNKKNKFFRTPKLGDAICLIIVRPGMQRKVCIGKATTSSRDGCFGLETGNDLSTFGGDCGNVYVDTNGHVVGIHFAEGSTGGWMVPMTEAVLSWLFRS